MDSQGVAAQGLRVEIIHGGDAASHQRRVQEWIDANSGATVFDLRHSAMPEPNARTGVGFSTMIIYRLPAAG